MLQGLANRKIKVEFKNKEDSLTSSVFGNLLFFTEDILWNILRRSCFDIDLPLNSGKILSYQFWPHWNSEDTSNKKYVEPDIFIEFENFNVIIEAKRWDYNQQQKGQWLNQYKAYQNEFETEELNRKDKKLIYFAIGGIRSKGKEKIDSNVFVYKIRWTNILNVIIEFENSLKDSEYFLYNSGALLRVTESIKIAFELHGFFTGKWLSSIKKIDPKLLKSLKTIDKWKI